jgi:hypothetical protein
VFCAWWSTVTRVGEKMNKSFIFVIGLVCLVLSRPSLGQTVVRVGAFPNIPHARAMVGKANGWFEKALGANVKNMGYQAGKIVSRGPVAVVVRMPR